MFTNHRDRNRDEVFRRGGNFILPKIFKFTSLIFGLILIMMITYDMGEKIYKSYNEKDEYEKTLENRRYLKNDDEDYTDEILPEILESNETNYEFNLNKTESEEFTQEDEEYKNKISNVIDLLRKQTYKGKWKMENKLEYLSNRSEGEISFRIERLISYTQVEQLQKVFVIFRLLDGHFIDKWLLVRSINSIYSNVSMTNTSFTQTFKSYVDIGEIFEKVNLVSNIYSDCKSTISLDWSKGNNTNNSVDFINGSFISNCGFGDIYFSLESEKEDEDYSKVMIYSVFVTILAISQIFNSIWLMTKINNSQTYANSVSIITLLQNIIWNAYGCLCHFFLTINYDVSIIILIFK
jgi:Txe/YoeB family toxin of Txe-Axe toxin-antitoxin module